ncbi:MAG: hypothetical protein ACREQC_12200 [Candidatus Binataceae bacterium]
MRRIPSVSSGVAPIVGLALSLALASGASAQVLISGVLSGHGNVPVSGAAVTLLQVGMNGAPARALGAATSGSDGRFSIAYTCPVGNPETYVTAIGGDAGGGVNHAIGLMAILGQCKAIGSQPQLVNELTTVAGEWAWAQFTDSTGASVSITTNTRGLITAANLARTNLVNTSAGVPASFLSSVA